MSDAVIVGIGETPVGELPGSTPLELQAQAVRLAVRDAGLERGDVDGLLNGPSYTRPHQMFALELAEYLGLRPRVAATVDVGGTATILLMVNTAIQLLRDGRCHAVACVFGDNMRTARPERHLGLIRISARRGTEEWEEPFGIVGMAIPYALVARRYMHLYGATREQLGAVAIAARKHALLNPNAQTRKAISLEEYLRSPMVASPLGRLDCSLVSDGGGALVLTTRSYARQRGLDDRKMAHILSYASKITHKNVNQLPDLHELPLGPVAREAYSQAGLSPKDINVALIHDAFTISTILGVEAVGLCGEGEGGSYAASGQLELGSAVPVNPHGGLLAQAHIGGMLHVVEAVRQLRGEAGERQVKDARVAAILGNGGVFSVAACMMLARG